MESKIGEALVSNPALLAYSIIALWKLVSETKKDLVKEAKETKSEFKELHQEAMSKIDDVNNSITSILKTNAVHARELEIGDDRFKALENDVRKLRDSNHKIINSMITKEQFEFLVNKEKN